MSSVGYKTHYFNGNQELCKYKSKNCLYMCLKNAAELTEAYI